MTVKKSLAGNTATGWLKILALLFMFCDHAGKMLLPNVPEMRMLGRIAFPLYWGATTPAAFPSIFCGCCWWARCPSRCTCGA